MSGVKIHTYDTQHITYMNIQSVLIQYNMLDLNFLTATMISVSLAVTAHAQKAFLNHLLAYGLERT